MTRDGNGVWIAFDRWADRIKLIIALLLTVGGVGVAWAKVQSELAILDKRVTAIERCIEEKIEPMRDQVLVIGTDVQSIKEDVAEIKAGVHSR